MSTRPATEPFLQQGGRMGELMRGHDWAATPLGPAHTWPQSLRTAVGLMLRSRQPIYVAWGPQLVSLYNDAHVPICGRKHPHALGRPMAEVWQEVWDSLGPITQACLRGEAQSFENMPFELAGRDEPGTSYFSFSHTPLLDDDGRVAGIFCAAVETTATVKAAHRREDEAQRLQRLFEQSPGFICTFRGPQHVFEFANAAHRQLFPRPDVVGKPVREAFPELEGQGFYERLDEVFLTGRRHVARGVPGTFRGTPDDPQPRRLVLDFIFAPVLDDEQRVTGIFCEGHDVTEAHAARQALREKEEQLRLATEAAEVSFWDVDVRAGTLYWPPRLRAMFGIAGDGPVTLDDFFAGLHPDDLEATSRAFAAAMDPARRARYDVEYRTVGRDDGLVRWVAANGRAFFDDAGRCVRVLGTAIDISERRTAKLAMEVALEASRSGTFRWDIRTDGLWWDKALDKLFGLAPGQAVHSLEQFVAMVHPDDRAAVVAQCARCRDEGVDFEMEFRAVHPDGTVRWLYDRGRTFLDANGRAETMTGACVDVTDRKRVAAALRESERFYRRTLESLPGMAFTADADGTCDYLSMQWEAYTGVPTQRLLGRDWLGSLHADDAPRVASAWNEAVRSRTSFSAEYRLRRHDGAYEWFQAHARVIGASDELPMRWIGSVQSIQALKEAEARLLARERELHSLADNSPDVIARFDPQLRHVFVNAALERLTGLPMALFLGRTNRELGMPGALCEQWDRAILKVFEERRPVSMQFEMEHATGVRHHASRLVPEIDEDGRVGHVLGVTRDITEAWHAQDALRRANRQKDEFLGTLAHELRNPLAPLRTGLSLLQRGGGTPEEQRVRQIMDRQIDHMVRMVDELLDVARISQGKVVLRREPLRVQMLLEHAVDASRPLLDGHGHTLVWTGADPHWSVHGDITRLVQVVCNLLNNAAKYTPPGGSIRLAAALDGPDVLVTVEDDGIGIPPEQLAGVFDRFVQVEQHREHAQGGLGIGLSVVRSLVEMHGGRVEAQSAGPGSGSRFLVWLPRVQAPVQPPPDAGGTRPVAAGPRRTVLIVDDNRDAAETLGMVVEMSGHAAHLAGDGPTALELAAAHRPALVFLDLGLPGMNGLEVASRLRQLPGWTGILVALTGRGTEEDRARTLAAGFHLHLTKPVDVHAVEQSLAALAGEPAASRP
ncbi:MAG TPA: PAS domain S-box protein [Ramlibacter sp.]|jgi:PAS domain S-box-containing protein|uniref:hybrid sensor histidine kinase/response regulator n=1 Tax=Ramlibacter sp. TaxID=1917967 RepID=UPI002D549A8A|nr:PAS domain S-box protein [Ramlibacter sp.]HZY18775.1 PAS domain S-box protein [Ramlibacter sp.]